MQTRNISLCLYRISSSRERIVFLHWLTLCPWSLHNNVFVNELFLRDKKGLLCVYFCRSVVFKPVDNGSAQISQSANNLFSVFQFLSTSLKSRPKIKCKWIFLSKAVGYLSPKNFKECPRQICKILLHRFGPKNKIFLYHNSIRISCFGCNGDNEQGKGT